MVDNSILVERIKALKREKNAVILAHYYTRPEVQQIADFIGDSLALSQKAADTDADIILFAGVYFMAETAKVLSPQKKVLIPDPAAGCSLADSCDAAEFEKFIGKYPDHKVVSYVNTSVGVKAITDVCCTSSNALKIVEAMPTGQKIIFAPDRNLGANVAKNLGRAIDLWPGYCPIHDRITVESVQAAKAAHPNALFLCHPECRPEVVALADHALSTGGMLRFIADASETEFIIGTESGILHRLSLDAAGKKLYPLAPLPVCHDMKKISLEDVLQALRTRTPVIELPADVIEKARRPIERMLAVHD